ACGGFGAAVYAALLLASWGAAGMPEGLEATVWRLGRSLALRLRPRSA
ncbi:hypothetical protein HUK83_16265, partial [Endobacter medicaginis]|nr:hypothetical protein [Endobacter medicaginis]